MDRRELEKYCNNPNMYWSELKKFIEKELDDVSKERRREYIQNVLWPLLKKHGLYDKSIVNEIVEKIYCTTAYSIDW